MVTATLGSIVLGSTRPAFLRDWYSRVLGGREEESLIHFGGFTVVIEERDDVSAQNPEPGRFIVNFHVDDFAAAAAQLEEAGVTWLAAPTDRPGGRFATFVDPDGNYLQVIQLNRPA